MTEAQLPVLRHDVTTKDWVLFAPRRSHRPHTATPRPATPAPTAPCPFCPGNEEQTPDEVERIADPGGRGWAVRAVANRYPALDRSADPSQRELGPVFREMGGYGVHEVVIESPDHSLGFAAQPLQQAERVVRLLQSRFVALMGDPRLRAIVVFKNHGVAAGTSQPHPHWQIIATPVVPRQLRLKHEVATEYFDLTSRCVYCVTRDEELASGTRVLAMNDEYVAVLPYASHVPYQVRILPREHRSSFGRVPDRALRPLARMLQLVLGRLEATLGNPDFNLTLGTAPLGDEERGYFLWHVDVLPRIATPAGFELGSGMSINPVLPEDAAGALRSGVVA